MPAEAWIAGASFVVSVCAFWLAWRADSRGQVAARSQLFLDLRAQFLKVLEDLRPGFWEPGWEPSDPEHKAAAMRYWHHAFDEWYVTTQLNEKLMRQLWDQFYRKAVLAGLKHDGLRKSFVEMMRTQVDLAKLWDPFRKQLDMIWAESHPDDGTKCPGVACAAAHKPA